MSTAEADEAEAQKELKAKFVELGFDDDRAAMLADAWASPYKAYHLIRVKGCPVDLAFEILF